MSRKELKACVAKNVKAVANKKQGWSSRYGGCTLMSTETRKPVSTISTLFPCSREECDKEESPGKRFKRCGVCLTIYCSSECQKSHWSQHKKFCKSEEAYVSQLNNWQETLPEELIYSNMRNGLVYFIAWSKWVDSEPVQKVLKFIGKTREDFIPYKKVNPGA